MRGARRQGCRGLERSLKEGGKLCVVLGQVGSQLRRSLQQPRIQGHKAGQASGARLYFSAFGSPLHLPACDHWGTQFWTCLSAPYTLTRQLRSQAQAQTPGVTLPDDS